MSIFLKEARQIADDLIARLNENEEGKYWESLTYRPEYDGPGQYGWIVSESIYDGNAGILLFFIQLYKTTGNENYLKTIKEVSNWLLQQLSKPSNTYSLFSGRLGVSYVLLQVYQLLQDNKYLEGAELAAKGCDDFLEKAWCDMMLGVAGCILPLLHLYEVTKKENYLRSIEKFTTVLIDKSWLGAKQGLYWDRTPNQIRGLCGFSHGASGVGVVFLELGKYFNNPAFYFLAREAFDYDDHYYDEENKSWPDFRKSNDRLEDITKSLAELEKGNTQYFYEPVKMDAWCHGASGIGISRLRAFQLLKNDNYRIQVENSLTKEIDLDTFDDAHQENMYILCHGFGGNADLHIEYTSKTDTTLTLDYVKEVAKGIIHKRKAGAIYRPGFFMSREEDPSLFMGNAGIGYFFLRLHDPSIPSFLHIPGPENSKDDFKLLSDSMLQKDTADFREMLICKKYARTMRILSQLGFTMTRLLKDSAENSTRVVAEKKFKEAVQHILQKKEWQKDYAALRDIYGLESSIAEIEESDLSNFYLATKTYARGQAIASGILDNDSALMSRIVCKNEHNFIIHTAYNWTLFDKNSDTPFSLQPADTNLLLVATPLGIMEICLSDLVCEILEGNKKPMSIAQLIKEIAELFETETAEELKQAREGVMAKIKELLQLQFLVLT